MAASDSSVSGSDIDDISFAPGGAMSTNSIQRRKLLKSAAAHDAREPNGDGHAHALCMDNRIRPEKAAGTARAGVLRRISRSRFMWPVISVATTSALLICLIAVLSRSCEVQKVQQERAEAKAKAKTACDGFPWSRIRLPSALIPVHYDLRVHPNISEQTFEGRVVVDFEVEEAVALIVFNSKGLRIDDHEVSLKNRRVKSWQSCDAREQVAVFVDRSYSAGESDSLTVSFRGNLSDGLRGLYRSSYKMLDGQRRFVAVTQFEPTDARRMFPCWDEPAYKAFFTMSIVREPNMISLSNMPQEKSTTDPQTGLVTDHYQKSLKMSTYLLALVVCDFPHVKKKTAAGVEISVYAPSTQIAQAENALAVGVDALEFLHSFFQIPYPLKKLDLIALADFAAGAMENWGLVTFRDNLVLFDPLHSSTHNEEAIATVVTHELGHQWFGNLVTMKWWSDLWLNEGFARFIENFATSRIRPDWNLMSMFVADATTEAMFLDGLNTTHAIFVNVTDPSEIESVFDAITYDKGAAVIYMLLTLVGEEPLKRGLHDYLNTHRYANAEGDDLWRILTKYTSNLGGLTLTEVAKSWTTQVGFPMINLTYRDGFVRAEQQRLLYLKEMRDADTSNTLWHVPMTVVTDLSPTKSTDFWLTKTRSGEAKLAPGFKWMKANVNGTAFYRVLYEGDNWRALAKQLIDDHRVFTASDRTLLLDDAFAFLRAGYLDVDTVFNLLEYFPKEANYGPADIILGYLSNTAQQLVESDLYIPYRQYVRQLILPLYNRVGWTPAKGHEEKLFQARVLGTSCRFDVADCKAKAVNLFWKWLRKEIALSPDLLGLVCSEAVYNGSGAAWEIIWHLYSNATVPSEKLTYLRSLAHAQQPWRLNHVLKLTLNPDSIRPNLMSLVGAQVAANSVGRLLAWRHVKMHWDDITKLVETTSILGNLIKGTIGFYNTLVDYRELVEFFRDRELGGSKAMVQETLEFIKINIQWRQLNERALEDWLKKKGLIASWAA